MKSILLNGITVIRAWDKSKEQEKKLGKPTHSESNLAQYIYF